MSFLATRFSLPPERRRAARFDSFANGRSRIIDRQMSYRCDILDLSELKLTSLCLGRSGSIKSFIKEVYRIFRPNVLEKTLALNVFVHKNLPSKVFHDR